jgi:hypothetical protein
MNRVFILSSFVFSLVTANHADVVVTIDGEELSGRIVDTSGNSVRYISSGTDTVTLKKNTIFMLKYNDGRKMVFSQENRGSSPSRHVDHKRFSASVFCANGLFGLVNINETSFDPGVYTIGVTPSIDYRLTRILSVGAEAMILWAKAKKAGDSRFIMNYNACVRLNFPVTAHFEFLTQLNAGLSVWPGAASTHATEPTFFMDRTGWDLHGALGGEYRLFKNGSILLYAGYNANFTTLNDIPITIDGLMISIGPKVEF